jgi:hypothetical protein
VQTHCREASQRQTSALPWCFKNLITGADLGVHVLNCGSEATQRSHRTINTSVGGGYGTALCMQSVARCTQLACTSSRASFTAREAAVISPGAARRRCRGLCGVVEAANAPPSFSSQQLPRIIESIPRKVRIACLKWCNVCDAHLTTSGQNQWCIRLLPGCTAGPRCRLSTLS